MAHDVFVSYSQKDKATADAIVARLEQDGTRCWIAPRDILPGTSWGEAIVDAITGSRVMVLVLSEHSNRSRQVVREVQRAVAGDVVILPFRIDAADPTGAMAYFLGTEHWLDALTPPMDQHIERLSRTVRMLLSREAIPHGELDQPPANLGRSRRRPWRTVALAGSAVVIAGGTLLAVALSGPLGPSAPSPTPVEPDPRVALVQVGGYRPLDLTPTDLNAPAPILSFDIDGTWLAYASGIDGVTRMSIGDPTTPRPVDTFGVYDARAAAWSGDRVAALAGEYETLDVSVFPVDGSGGPTLPIQAEDITGLSDIDADDRSIWVSGHDYVAGFDATDPDDLAQIFEWRPPGHTGNAAGVLVAGDVLHVAAGWDGLYLFSIADPAAPAMLGHWISPDWVIDVAVDGTVAYVALGDTGVAALDVTDPAAPRLLGSVKVPGFANAIDAAEGHAFVGWSDTDGSLGGIAIVDFTDPTLPVLVDTVGRFASLSHLQLAGDHLYVSDLSEGLVAYQVTTTD